MKMRRLILFSLAVLLCLSAVSCRKYDGYKHGAGYYYQYHQRNEGGERPQTGDFVEVNMALRAGDEVITPMTRNNMMMDDLYHGDIYSALRKMHLGDSATFIFDGRKFYEKFLGMGEYPYGKTPVYADVKLLKILSKRSIDQSEELFREQRKQQRQVEDSLLKAYANTYHLNNVHKGIYYTVNRKGGGVKGSKNKIAQILFKARRIDNREFDRCLDPANPFTFEIGKDQVARGIDIIVKEMNEGDQITALFPSSLAFGDKGSTDFDIPPFTPVVYELELLRVKDK